MYDLYSREVIGTKADMWVCPLLGTLMRLPGRIRKSQPARGLLLRVSGTLPAGISKKNRANVLRTLSI